MASWGPFQSPFSTGVLVSPRKAFLTEFCLSCPHSVPFNQEAATAQQALSPPNQAQLKSYSLDTMLTKILVF